MSTGIVKKLESRTRRSILGGRKFWWVQVAANGQILSTSETYTTKEKCDQTARLVASQLGVPYREKDGE